MYVTYECTITPATVLAGVKFDVRKLNVGDFVWVAKEKAVPLPGMLLPPCHAQCWFILNALFHAGQLGLPPSREILLEHVVERKRMDDLAGSITDGRFHEQKVHHIDTKTW